MHQAIIGALIVSASAASGMTMNEATHGGVSELVGLGHHHAADFGQYHCASHTGTLGPQHVQHMHNQTSIPHDGCPGGSSMHGQGGMMNG